MNNKKLLILHGWGSNSKRWQRVKEILEKKNIEVLVPNLPGFGIEPPPQNVWGALEYEKWILDFAEKEGWEKFSLLGHSFGGGLAVRVATDFPHKIEKLILCSPAVIREKSKKTLAIQKIGKVGKKFIQKIGREKIGQILAKVFYRLIGALDYYRANGIMKEVMKKIISEDLSLSLKKIQQPTLILWGQKDYVVPLNYAYRIKEEIEAGDTTHLNERVKLVILPRAGHPLNTQIPDRIAEEIINFLVS